MLIYLLRSIFPTDENLYDHYTNTETLNECKQANVVLDEEAYRIYLETAAELERRQTAISPKEKAKQEKIDKWLERCDAIQQFFRRNWPTRYEDLPRSVQLKVDVYHQLNKR